MPPCTSFIGVLEVVMFFEKLKHFLILQFALEVVPFYDVCGLLECHIEAVLAF